MKTLRTLCIVAVLFAAMAQAQEADSVIEQAEVAIASKLKDPESAHFSDVTISEKGNLVCGWVNAKNSFGGYVGFRPFVVSGSYVQLRDEPNVGPLNNRGIFAITWDACRPLGAEVFGNAHVDLPKINSAKYCKQLRKTLSRVSETSPDCERDEAEAQAWLQTHTTDAWVARDCAQKAREVRSYGTARSCVREGEADIVFRRGPRNNGTKSP